ncbi:hypothetical protein SDC9_131437 [bioreactor metagenome]|uniref:Uncharacterized protein n=1 Tax=bioreactor metagenome TaxID=1076179 RepID=A0A645D4R6_9ZZZZ
MPDEVGHGARGDDGVGVHRHHDVAADRPQPVVERPGLAGVGLAHQHHPGVLGRDPGDGVGGAVRRPVVDHDDLQQREVRGEQRPYGPGDHRFLVVGGDHHRHRQVHLLGTRPHHPRAATAPPQREDQADQPGHDDRQHREPEQPGDQHPRGAVLRAGGPQQRPVPDARGDGGVGVGEGRVVLRRRLEGVALLLQEGDELLQVLPGQRPVPAAVVQQDGEVVLVGRGQPDVVDRRPGTGVDGPVLGVEPVGHVLEAELLAAGDHPDHGLLVDRVVGVVRGPPEPCVVAGGGADQPFGGDQLPLGLPEGQVLHVGVVEGVDPDRVPLPGHPGDQVGLLGDVAPHHEEGRRDVVRGQHVEDALGVGAVGPVVEGQRDRTPRALRVAVVLDHVRVPLYGGQVLAGEGDQDGIGERVRADEPVAVIGHEFVDV